MKPRRLCLGILEKRLLFGGYLPGSWRRRDQAETVAEPEVARASRVPGTKAIRISVR